MAVRAALLALVVLLSGCVLPGEEPASFPTLPVVALFNESGGPVTVTVTTLDANGTVLDVRRHEVAGEVVAPPPSLDPACATMVHLALRVEGPDGLDRHHQANQGCTDEWQMVLVDGNGALHLRPLPREGPDALPDWERGDDWPEDVGPERFFQVLVPSLSLTRESTVRDGRDTFAFTVVQVRNGPVLWEDLEMECTDGSGPEAWGGEHEEEAPEVRAGNRIYCDGTHLSIRHTPTDTVLYDQAV